MIPAKERQLLKILTDCAKRGDKCPTNLELTDMLKLRSVIVPSRMMKNLERAGLISVTRFSRSRIVTIASTRKSTAEVDEAVKVAGDKTLSSAQLKRLQTPTPRTFAGIDRTPCIRCGVRADVGCRHVPKSEGWEIVV